MIEIVLPTMWMDSKIFNMIDSYINNTNVKKIHIIDNSNEFYKYYKANYVDKAFFIGNQDRCYKADDIDKAFYIGNQDRCYKADYIDKVNYKHNQDR
jgi:hypothetical protein